MTKLRALTEKLTWGWLVVIILYLGALIAFAGVILPKNKQTEVLQARLEQISKNEANLLRILEQKPDLESKQQELGKTLGVIGREVPSQYDLTDVLEFMTKLAAVYQVEITELSHVPMQAMPGEKSGLIPITLELKGDASLLEYLVHLQAALPSLQFIEVALGNGGDKQFFALASVNLHVLILEKASELIWEDPFVYRGEIVLNLTGFGLPFELINQFLGKNVQVLGVVQGTGQSAALVQKNGVKQWLKVGDHLEQAVVKEILENSLLLDLDGVALKLTIGGGAE